MVVIQILYSYFQVGTPLALLNGVVKQINVRVERELVHRIYLAHVIQDEKQDRGSLRARSVTLVTKYEPGYVLSSSRFPVNLLFKIDHCPKTQEIVRCITNRG